MFDQLSLQALKKNDGLPHTKHKTKHKTYKHSNYWNLHYDTTLIENCWAILRLAKIFHVSVNIMLLNHSFGLIFPGPGDCRDLDLPFLYF